MYILVFGCILFFAPHVYSAFRSRDAVRDMRARMGSGKFMGLYSLFTGIGFVLMIWGYGLARPSTVVYAPPEWGALVNTGLMLPALILLIASNSPYGYLKKYVKHPMLAAVILWSIGHLLSNGELNSVILFGSFLAYGLLDRVAVMARQSAFNVKPPSLFADIFVVLLGTAIYWIIYQYLHSILFGVPVI